MAVTVTRALERDRQVVRRSLQRPRNDDLVLAAISMIVAMVIVATYLGRTTLSLTTQQRGVLVNLNTVPDAARLEPALAPAFDTPADRRLAARELFGFLAHAGGGRRSIRNVGAIAQATVPIAAIERDPELRSYHERLRAARARTEGSGTPLQSLPLLTSSDLSAVKPFLVVRDRRAVRNAVLLWAVLYLAAFHLVSLAWRVRAVRGDRAVVAAVHLLTGIGFAVMIARSDPLRDTMLFVRFAQTVLVGAGVMALVSLANFRTSALRQFSFVPLAGAFVLSLLLIVFGSGPAGSNAKVNLGPVQPIEAIRLLIVLFLAGYFGRRWELLRAVRSETVRGRSMPAWLNVPRLEYLVPVLFGVALALGLFFVQRDLGPALVISVVFLAMYAIARGGVVMTLTGFALLAAGFFVGYQIGISSTLTERVRMWQSPWDNAARGGDQIAQALWALATGSTFGTGLGLGDTRYLPAGHTDLALAAVAEELGFVGMFVIAVAYLALVWRGVTTARRASTEYTVFLALGMTLLIAIPVLLMTAGVLGLVPLTGVVTPFVSYGGSAMLANFVAAGVLTSIRSDSQTAADLRSLEKPVRWTAASLAVAALASLLVIARVQIVRADEIVVRPHLGIQGDGTRRYQYNPRILDVVREIPRGRVLDRRGLPLATETAADARPSRADYQRLGISLDEACPDPAARCYPLGSRAFHLLGNARTRLNWGASNTAFLERDAEAKLRGFDDHETLVRTVDTAGGPAWALRRDYRDLVPLLRHRRRSSHRAVTAILNKPRDVQTTIDAALQVRTAAILAAHVSKSASGRGAAVVLDSSTGDLLASVSYPWPVDEAGHDPGKPADDLLDRPRFGLYPPGSTFKIVTAAAALRQKSSVRDLTFTCSRLPDSRVGARISGWGRPVRDDELDRVPHGRIGMHEAMSVSCNAYFAQLAVRLGPEALISAAQPLGLSLARGNTVANVRDALPQVGYGQGEVVATPLRMARVAATIAADGIIPDTRWESTPGTGEPHAYLSREHARLLGRYMRDVVVSGTGRALRNHPLAIAGKTGTAEVAGAASHSWFIGFAPYGPASRRVAIAVLIENAGYGGSAATPAAGEIFSAAAALGLVK
jgi:cell division protein FtsW (lipid II flippase)